MLESLLPSGDEAQTWLTPMLQFGLQVLGAAALLVIGWWLSGFISKRVMRLLERVPRMDATLSPIIASLARYGVLIATLLAVLALFGVPVASFLVLLSGAALAIGLALQGTLSNVASGFLLLILRPFNVGEYITAAGQSGTVREIGLFVTTLQTLEYYMITLPNTAVLTASITNYSRHPFLRTNWSIDVAYDSDLPQAISTIQAVLKADSRILSEPQPQVFVAGFSDSAIQLRIRAAAKSADFWTAEQDLRLALKNRFEAEGIEIPFPQRVVQLRSNGGDKQQSKV